MKTLKDLFLDELADVYDAECRMTKALPHLIKTATCKDLQAALQAHLEETLGQKEKLDAVFLSFHKRAQGKASPPMAGVVEEVDELASAGNRNSPAINAAIISVAQKANHYEIASLGCLHAWSILLDNRKASQVLQGILDDVKASDHRLNELAASKNLEALEQVRPGTYGKDCVTSVTRESTPAVSRSRADKNNNGHMN